MTKLAEAHKCIFETQSAMKKAVRECQKAEDTLGYNPNDINKLWEVLKEVENQEVRKAILKAIEILKGEAHD